MDVNKRDETIVEVPNALLTLPGEGDLEDDIIEAIRLRHGKVAICVSIYDSEPTLYLSHERRAIVGVRALYAAYSPAAVQGHSRR